MYRFCPTDEISFRAGFEGMPGVMGSQRRFNLHGGRVLPAFESLDLIGVDAALDFLEEPLGWMVADEDRFNGIIGMVLSFGILCVEAERERVREAQMKT